LQQGKEKVVNNYDKFLFLSCAKKNDAMKKVILFFLFLVYCGQGVAQSSPRIVGYFDGIWRLLPDSIGAAYYRTIEDLPTGEFKVVDYYMSGQPQMDPVICKVYLPKLKWEGSIKLYHPNGKVSEEGLFKDEKRFGLHVFWDNTGMKLLEVTYDDDEIKTYHQGWSQDGRELINNGDGIVQVPLIGYYSTYVEVKNHELIGSFIIENSDTVYLQAEVAAEYIGGFQKYYKKLGANIQYPKSARRAGIEGKVFVEFIIAKQGKGTQYKVIKGISSDCDAEAIRVMRLMNDWKPGRHNGKPVNMKFVLPITYKLG
jgi:TonB family protein